MANGIRIPSAMMINVGDKRVYARKVSDRCSILLNLPVLGKGANLLGAATADSTLMLKYVPRWI